MITAIADNIISPLGDTTAENFCAVMSGQTMLRIHEGVFGLPESFCGSLLDRAKIDRDFERECSDAGAFTFFERLCILSASRAIAQRINPADPGVIFVLSTTKGNVALLEADAADPRCLIASSASRIARYFGNGNTPVVASNACISGVCAQIAAVRTLLAGRYHTAVVIGCDVLSKFIVSGFQSFKALSSEPCRPFDSNRTGLNLGEASATLILTTAENAADRHFIACSNHNDANHISGPSRTGEGSFRVLADLLKTVNPADLAFTGVHGTATAYNDEMESIALDRAKLSGIPVCAFKGYYGHTLGAAGVLETILSMEAVDHDVIPGVKGFLTQGTSRALNISPTARPAKGHSFIKILSGFGGSNAGIAYRKGGIA